MNKTDAPMPGYNEPALTEICVQGHLDECWCDWFAGLTITSEEDGRTRLTGQVPDQSALYGLLRKVRDLGLPLLSIYRVELDRADGADINQRTRGNK